MENEIWRINDFLNVKLVFYGPSFLPEQCGNTDFLFYQTISNGLKLAHSLLKSSGDAYSPCPQEKKSRTGREWKEGKFARPRSLDPSFQIILMPLPKNV
jgi:hypothetical protein